MPNFLSLTCILRKECLSKINEWGKVTSSGENGVKKDYELRVGLGQEAWVWWDWSGRVGLISGGSWGPDSWVWFFFSPLRGHFWKEERNVDIYLNLEAIYMLNRIMEGVYIRRSRSNVLGWRLWQWMEVPCFTFFLVIHLAFLDGFKLYHGATRKMKPLGRLRYKASFFLGDEVSFGLVNSGGCANRNVPWGARRSQAKIIQETEWRHGSEEVMKIMRHYNDIWCLNKGLKTALENFLLAAAGRREKLNSRKQEKKS